jgi:hypothetical protein
VSDRANSERPFSLVFALCFSLLISSVWSADAETVTVKYRESPVPLDSFQCQSIERSSFIRRVCYDQKNSYMIVQLNETYYHYCNIDKATVDAFDAADSMGRFYNASIKGHFDCRTGRMPPY